VLLRLKPERSNRTNSFLFENADTEEGFMLRAPHGRLPEDLEYVSVEMTVDTSGAEGQFILFLREVVRREPDRIHTAFDDHRLVTSARRLLPLTLAQRLELSELVEGHLDLGRTGPETSCCPWWHRHWRSETA